MSHTTSKILETATVAKKAASNKVLLKDAKLALKSAKSALKEAIRNTKALGKEADKADSAVEKAKFQKAHKDTLTSLKARAKQLDKEFNAAVKVELALLKAIDRTEAEIAKYSPVKPTVQ